MWGTTDGLSPGIHGAVGHMVGADRNPQIYTNLAIFHVYSVDTEPIILMYSDLLMDISYLKKQAIPYHGLFKY